MNKRTPLPLVSSGFLVLLAGCGHLWYADGPYRGRVIDQETKRPIEGAAVLAVWWKHTPGVAQPIISFYDAQETLTDPEGHFTIRGIFWVSLNPLAEVQDPLFIVFKPGYEAYGHRKLASSREEGRTVVELRALRTREERLRNLDRIYPGPRVPKEKYPTLSKLEMLEEVNLGLRPKKEGQP